MKNPNQILDEALNDIRYEAIDPSAVKNAADRVWARVAQRGKYYGNYTNGAGGTHPQLR